MLAQTTRSVALAAGGFLLCSVASAAPVYSDGYFMINPIQACDDNGANCADMRLFKRETTKIYAVQAATLPIFLSPTVINNSSVLNGSSSVAAVNQPGRGQWPTANVLNGFFVNSLATTPGDVLFGRATLGGNAFVINTSAVNAGNGGLGRADTVAHEIGHNLGMEHDTLGAGGAKNLMTQGGDRATPTGTNDIWPDGLDLDRMTAEQIDTVRSSPFVSVLPENLFFATWANELLQFRLDLSSDSVGPVKTRVRSFYLDLSAIGASFTPTTPLSVLRSGINLSGVTSSLNAERNRLQIDFPDSIFEFGIGGPVSPGFECDANCLIDALGSVTFGIGVSGAPDDPLDSTESFGGALAGFGFSTGFGTWSPIDGRLGTASSRLVSDTFLTTIETPYGRVLAPGELGPMGVVGDPDPEPLPLPATPALAGLALIALARQRRWVGA